MTHLKSLVPTLDDYRHANVPRDLLAGVTVGIVALPLALAFGVSSGVGAAAGLVTAIVAGLLAAVFGGSHVQVSGPTGAMVVILAPLVATHGVESVMLLSLMAGAFVLGIGLLGLGRAISLIPWSVVEGFTLGIATLIALQQVPMAMGTDIPAGLNSLFGAFLAVREADWALSVFTLSIVAVTVLIILVTSRISATFPSSLVAVVVVSVAMYFSGTTVPTIGALPDSLPAPSIPSVDLDLLFQLSPPAIAIALLAAIESLLSARVASGMPGQRGYDPDRELVGQGIASIGSGMFGGMPATGAIARTAVNVKSGATSRISAIVHAILLVAVVYFAAGLVAHIPLSALAGVLFVTAFRMVSVKAVKTVTRSTKGDFIIFWATAIITIVFDLVVAIGIGLVIAVLWSIFQISRLSGVLPVPLPGEKTEHDDNIVLIRLFGAMFFGAADRISQELAEFDDNVKVVIISMMHVGTMDASGAKSLVDVLNDLTSQGIITMMSGLRSDHMRVVKEVGVIEALSNPEYVYETKDQAARAARAVLAAKAAKQA